MALAGIRLVSQILVAPCDYTEGNLPRCLEREDESVTNSNSAPYGPELARVGGNRTWSIDAEATEYIAVERNIATPAFSDPSGGSVRREGTFRVR